MHDFRFMKNKTKRNNRSEPAGKLVDGGGELKEEREKRVQNRGRGENNNEEDTSDANRCRSETLSSPSSLSSPSTPLFQLFLSFPFLSLFSFLISPRYPLILPKCPSLKLQDYQNAPQKGKMVISTDINFLI
jgi:hypothetical protein